MTNSLKRQLDKLRDFYRYKSPLKIFIHPEIFKSPIQYSFFKKYLGAQIKFFSLQCSIKQQKNKFHRHVQILECEEEHSEKCIVNLLKRREHSFIFLTKKTQLVNLSQIPHLFLEGRKLRFDFSNMKRRNFDGKIDGEKIDELISKI